MSNLVKIAGLFRTNIINQPIFHRTFYRFYSSAQKAGMDINDWLEKKGALAGSFAYSS